MIENGNYSLKENKEMEKDGIILFDIDRVLFDADAFEQMIYEKTGELTGLGSKKIELMKNEYRANLAGYTTSELLDYISLKTETNLTSFKEYLTDESIYSKYIFDDIPNVLTKLSAKYRLGILSNGEHKTQLKKIYGIMENFDPNLVFITNGKTNDQFLKEVPDAIVIDDDEKIVKELKTKGRFNVFWLNRKNNETIITIPTVRNVDEFAEQILKVA